MVISSGACRVACSNASAALIFDATDLSLSVFSFILVFAESRRVNVECVGLLVEGVGADVFRERKVAGLDGVETLSSSIYLSLCREKLMVICSWAELKFQEIYFLIFDIQASFLFILFHTYLIISPEKLLLINFMNLFPYSTGSIALISLLEADIDLKKVSILFFAVYSEKCK